MITKDYMLDLIKFFRITRLQLNCGYLLVCFKEGEWVRFNRASFG